MGSTVAVIIPCYNMSRFIRDTVQSVLDQTCAAAEIVVVDDGSTDGSPEIVESFRGVRCIRQKNARVSEARNNGLRQSSSEYVVFLDADDMLMPRALEIGVRELDARPECGFVYGGSVLIDPQGRALRDTTTPAPDAGFRRLLSGRGLTPPAVAMFRRSALQGIEGFIERLEPTEDHDLYMRVARERPIHCHGQAVAYYRQHESNMSQASSVRTLRAVLASIDNQRQWYRGKPELEAAAREGRRRYVSIFGPGLAHELALNLKRRRFKRAWLAFAAMVRYYPRGFVEYPFERLGINLSRPVTH